MLAELHCHTVYSKGTKIVFEGLNTPKEMIIRAKKIGLDALAITDHNVVVNEKGIKGYAKKNGVFLISGEEISTNSGHLIGLGIEETIKPYLSFEETLDKIHEQGGIAIAPHPFDVQKKGLGKNIENLRKCDALEVFNALNLERISNWKARRFAEKNKLPGVAGSDAHTSLMLGRAITEIKAEQNLDSILNAIKEGRIRICCNYVPIKNIVDWSVERLQLSYIDVVEYIDENYTLPKKYASKKMLKLVKKHPGKIDYLFRAFAYIGVGVAIPLSAIRNFR